MKCHFWVMGINNHWVKSCATHKSLLNLTFISTLLWKLKANFSLCFGRKTEEEKQKPQAEPPWNLSVTVTREGGVPEQRFLPQGVYSAHLEALPSCNMPLSGLGARMQQQPRFSPILNKAF